MPLSFHFFILLLILTTPFILYLSRDKWFEKVAKLKDLLDRGKIRLDGYHFLPNSHFQNDIESGLTSSNFDLQLNNNNDDRKGLDKQAKFKILEIMNNEGISFDAARLQFFKVRLSENNIAPDGTPLDPRAFTFGSNKSPQTL